MRRISRHSVEFRALQEAHWHAQLATLFYDALQSQIVTLLGKPHPLKRAAPRLDRLRDRVQTVDVIHGIVSVLRERLSALGSHPNLAKGARLGRGTRHPANASGICNGVPASVVARQPARRRRYLAKQLLD